MSITDYKITTNYGERDNFHPQPHQGIDFAIPLYTHLEATDDALVISESTNNMLGNNICLKLNDGDIIVYGHLAQFKVKTGQYVHKGDIVGLSGGMPGMPGAGHSTGPHLHFGMLHEGKLVDPTNYLFHHQTQQSNSSSLVFPVMIVLILVLIFKYRKFVLYGLGIIVLLAVIFLVS